MTLRLFVLLSRLLLVPVLPVASLAAARVLPLSPLALLGLAYAACLLGCAAWPRRSLRRVGVSMAGWLVLCWAMGIPHGSDGAGLGLILAGCLACALPRLVRDFQRLARSREHMDLAELQVARRRAGRAGFRPARWRGGASPAAVPAPREGG